MNRIFFMLLCIFFSSVSFAGYPVDVVSTEVRDVRIRFKAFNKLTAERSVTVRSEMSGLIEKQTVSVEVGAKVRAGVALFHIDSLAYQATLANARSALAQAQLDLRLEQGRQSAAGEELRFITSTIATDTTDAPTVDRELILRIPHLEAARARLVKAQKDYQYAKQQLAKTTVRAPCNGFIYTINTAVGEYINAGAELMKFVCDDQYRIIATVPMHQYPWLQKKYINELDVTLIRRMGALRQTLPAELVRVVPAIEQASRMVQVYIRVTNNHQANMPLLLDEFVTVEFSFADQVQAIGVPISALRSIDTIWVADGENKLSIEQVEVLYQDTRYVYLPLSFGVGKQVITTPIANPVAGMTLEINSPSAQTTR